MKPRAIDIGTKLPVHIDSSFGGGSPERNFKVDLSREKEKMVKAGEWRFFGN